MKFSVILPVYKVEKYLRPCVDSILHQTYKDFEVILVDDGSPDKCPEICDDYARIDARVQVIHKPNGGLSDARNVGLKHAKGEYIFFLDSDDYLIDENVLQKIVKASEGEQDVVAFKFIKWYESNGQLSTCKFSYNLDTTCKSASQIYLELIDKDAYYNSAWSKVVKRSLLVDNNIEFERGLLGEDNDWYYKVVAHVRSLSLIDEPLYVYRQRSGSITKTSSNKNLEHILWIIEKWVNYVNEGELTENKMVIRNSLAKQYCHAIIGYASLPHSEEFYEKLKSYNYLLQFSRTPRVIIFRKINRFLGLRGTIFALHILRRK